LPAGGQRGEHKTRGRNEAAEFGELPKKYLLRSSLTAAAKAGAENEPVIAALKCVRENLFLGNSVEGSARESSPGGASQLSPALQRWEKWKK